jgi:YidC/Oxa1 family membrane protein insertase
MDNLRLILFLALAMVLFMLWQAWEQDYGTLSAPAQSVQSDVSVPGAQPAAPAQSGQTDVPAVSASSTIDDSASPATPAVASAEPTGEVIRVETDLLQLEIDTLGGTVSTLYLSDYPVSLKTPDIKFRLMKPNAPNLYLAQSGLIAGKGSAAPNHKSLYQSARSEYRMADGVDSLTVDLVWRGNNGVAVTKRFIFNRGSYAITVQHLVNNGSGAAWSGREYRQLVRSPGDKEGESAFMYTYTGGAIYSPEEKYEKISFDDIEDKDLKRDVQGGWIGMLQHYFIGAWVPPAEQSNHFYSKELTGGSYQLGAYTPSVSVAPGTEHTFESRLVVGPKLQNDLKEIATGLDLTVDYGWLTILAKPIFWLLSKIHALLGNWGWAILVLTLIIKLAFFKLSATSYRSMANMRKMTPRMQALKDRYGDDKQRLNQAMMDLYKKEKINPLGGCLPILVQIPVFIALYWVLLEAVELRQAPFILWITDLSIKDPYYVLPLIMGASMFVQQKLNPAPPDPMQAKIMMSLPFVFTIFFAFFPAGLVLYWVANNLLSIAQQWYITRQIEAASA